MSSVTVEQLEAMVKDYADLRSEIELDKVELSAKNETLDELEGKIAATLKELGKQSYKSEAGLISRVERWRVNLPQTPDEKQQLRDYLREKGLEDMLTVNSNTMNSYYMKEWDEVKAHGDPEEAMNFRIPGIGEPKVHEILSFRKK